MGILAIFPQIFPEIKQKDLYKTKEVVPLTWGKKKKLLHKHDLEESALASEEILSLGLQRSRPCPHSFHQDTFHCYLHGWDC